MKRGTESKIKFKLLGKDLGHALWQTKGLLQTLWDFCASNCPEGDIGRFANEEIALGIDWREEPDVLVSALVRRHWLDEHDELRLVVHDWPEHCEDAVHQAIARKGGLFWDGSMPKLSRFPKEERKAIDKLYASKRSETPANASKRSETPANASERPENAPTLPSRALPSRALPSPAMPSRALPSSVARSLPPGGPGGDEPELEPTALKAGKQAGVCKANKTARQAGTDQRDNVFQKLTVADLTDTGRLLAWHEWASSRPKPVVGASEADRLRVVGAAERALEQGTKPVALFASLIANGQWDFIREAQEERARRRLADYDRQARGPAKLGEIIQSVTGEKYGQE